MSLQRKRRPVVYRGPVFQVVRDLVTINGRPAIRDTIEHPGAVVIVPFLDRCRIVFVSQYRHAVRRQLLELPAGTLKPGEGLAACARRELVEETGWWPRRLRRLARFYAAPGYTSEALTLFLAQDLVRVQAEPDADEQVRPALLSYRVALAKIQSGAICDAKTIIGVLLARRFLSDV